MCSTIEIDEELLSAIRKYDEEKFIAIIDKNDKPYSDLYMAAVMESIIKYSCSNMLEYLLEEKHVNADLENDIGETPLCKAAFFGRNDMISCLIHHGANPNYWNPKNKKGYPYPPIIYAMINGKIETIKWLLDRGANLVINGRLCATVAGKREDSLTLIKYLVEKQKIDVNMKTLGEDTLLCNATLFMYYDIIEYLLRHRANPNIPGSENQTPLEMVVSKNLHGFYLRSVEMGFEKDIRADVVKLLIAVGAKFEPDKLLPIAEKVGDEKIINLLKYGQEEHSAVSERNSLYGNIMEVLRKKFE